MIIRWPLCRKIVEVGCERKKKRQHAFVYRTSMFTMLSVAMTRGIDHWTSIINRRTWQPRGEVWQRCSSCLILQWFFCRLRLSDVTLSHPRHSVCQVRLFSYGDYPKRALDVSKVAANIMFWSRLRQKLMGGKFWRAKFSGPCLSEYLWC